jgi:hypothetical protein
VCTVQQRAGLGAGGHVACQAAEERDERAAGEPRDPPVQAHGGTKIFPGALRAGGADADWPAAHRPAGRLPRARQVGDVSFVSSRVKRPRPRRRGRGGDDAGRSRLARRLPPDRRA